MAWRSHADDNAGLVQALKKNGIVKDERVAEAMRKVDRQHYSPKNPYEDSPQTIGYHVTISAPHMHAYALELLADRLKPGMRALDVGSGSGYLTVCMSHMVGNDGLAVGIEHIPELVQKATVSLPLLFFRHFAANFLSNLRIFWHRKTLTKTMQSYCKPVISNSWSATVAKAGPRTDRTMPYMLVLLLIPFQQL